MGCDIHMYVEYTYTAGRLKEPLIWSSFGSGFLGNRNYQLFGYLAGVRYNPKNALLPKGLPKELAYISDHDTKLYITEDGEGEHETTMKKALAWNKERGCQLYKGRNGKVTWVDNPNWHSHSWLTTNEFASVLKRYSKDEDGWGEPIDYKGMLGAMRAIEKDGYYVARIVFWFDS